jgi:hypothetical protein
MEQAILISLSSFGAAEVRRHGQAWFARLAAQAGADGVEVRGELLVDPDTELPSIAQAVPALERVYSSPEPLYAEDGTLALAALERGLAAARQLAAKRLKMSTGPGAAASRTPRLNCSSRTTRPRTPEPWVRSTASSRPLMRKASRSA